MVDTFYTLVGDTTAGLPRTTLRVRYGVQDVLSALLLPAGLQEKEE